MLFYISILFIVAILIARYYGPFPALLLIVATKSIIDATWSSRIGPLSLISIEGILLPILFFKTISPRIVKKRWFNLAWLLFIAYNTGIIFGLVANPMGAAETFIKNINILLAFFLIPTLVDTKEKFRKLLVFIILGGIFPILMSIYQKQTGVVWQERQTVGLTRMVGMYHDAFPIRFYGQFTIFSSLLYFYFFSVKKIFNKILLTIIIFAALFSIYNVFSKAAVAILLSWTIIFLIFSQKRSLSIALIALIILAIPFLLGIDFSNNIEQLFSKEIGFRSGKIDDARYTLAGRGYIWEGYLNFWQYEQIFIFKIFGDGLSRPAHNEFLRILLLSGVLGVLLFIIFLFRVGFISIFSKGPFKPFILMLFAMYFIDSLGLSPGDYYYYNILVWGFIGLFLLRPHIIYDY